MPITTSTNLNFHIDDRSLWGPGTATNLYIDTGDTLIFDPDEAVKKWGIDIWVMEASFKSFVDL